MLLPGGAGQWDRLAEWLKEATGIDLGSYKRPYMQRRVQARMRKLRLSSLDAYLKLLEGDPVEPEALVDALTVHVTQFFRNPGTFQRLEQLVYPPLFDRARPGRPVRIWSLGCAGGEEPYSVALQLAAHRAYRNRYRILATDVAPAVLARARQGVYEEQALAGIPLQWREEVRSRDDGTFCLSPRLRQSVRFRRQNILDLNQYVACDLVLCRNVLIYFDRSRQADILQRLGVCLADKGYLVLGRSETLTEAARNRFRCVDSAERIYQKV